MTQAAQQFTPQQLEDWKAYEEVRSWGTYNMFSAEARHATALTKDAYTFVMKNYTALQDAVQGAA